MDGPWGHARQALLDSELQPRQHTVWLLHDPRTEHRKQQATRCIVTTAVHAAQHRQYMVVQAVRDVPDVWYAAREQRVPAGQRMYAALSVALHAQPVAWAQQSNENIHT